MQSAHAWLIAMLKVESHEIFDPTVHTTIVSCKEPWSLYGIYNVPDKVAAMDKIG